MFVRLNNLSVFHFTCEEFCLMCKMCNFSILENINVNVGDMYSSCHVLEDIV